MAVNNIQGINIRPITFLLQRHFKGHEIPSKLCLCQGRGDPYHYKLNDKRCIRLTDQTPKNKRQASVEPSAPCIPDTLVRA